MLNEPEGLPTAAPATESELGVALVTGGRKGIGRAICLSLAQRGFDIAIVDIVEDQESLETVTRVENCGRRALFAKFDIADTANHKAMIEDLSNQVGKITCLVNNAGVQVQVRGDLLDCSESEFDDILAVNLRGTFFLTQAVARHMVEAAEPGRERSIISITSANAGLVSPEKGPYCVSKAGLSMATQQFALRLASEGIRVHEIRPGLISTDMTADVRDKYSPTVENGTICPMKRWGIPEDVAEAVATLAIGAMPFSTGDIYNVGGGMQIPRL